MALIVNMNGIGFNGN